MFNSIRGLLTAKAADAAAAVVRVETAGVEWELAVPLTDADALPDVGKEARVYTWLLHREDTMRLFGFSSEKRRATFLELLRVEGIGPGKAVQIMGRITQEELERALEKEDLDRLEAVPGLGKKTAQKMLLALKGKLVRAEKGAALSTAYSELTEALAEMGYDRKTAQEALDRAARDLPEGLSGAEKEHYLFKHAIVYLSGG